MSVIDNKHFVIRSNVEVHGPAFAVRHEAKRLIRIGMNKKAAMLQAISTVRYAMKR